MAQTTQPVTLGDPQALQWRCHWMPAPGLQAPELCWARLELHVQGQQLWGEHDPHEGQMAWPLVDLLSGVARIWPWLLLEEAYPIDIHPEHLGLMMGVAEQRWSDLPEVQAHAEEDALFDFRQRHDLSMLWRGLNVAPLWLLRQGLDCQVWSPKLTKPVFIPHQVVMNSLQHLGDLLANHIALSDAATRHPRAQQALTRWQKRTPHALATEAIHMLIEQKEREYAWAESCDAALKHFDETGLHATHDEVMAWVESWGTDKELPAPACHH